MKWVIIKGVRYPSSVISAFAAYNMDNPFLKVRIRNKYHIVPFDDVNKMASQMVYLMDNYPDFVQIGRWWISKKAVMSWVPNGQAVDGSGWVISFTLSFGLEGGAQIRTYYASEEDVYRFNDLIVVDKNGDIRMAKSPKSKLMLTNDQLDVVERMKGIIDDMVRLKMIMYIDQDYNLCFLPGDKIEDLTMDETDGFVDTTGIVTHIKSKDVVEFYVENPFVKIKDE